ncbi:alpha/beta fold hydrolase [Lysinibacillus odysseyi]|uniref:Alpha/beta hydrolase n=1 Tax=Lysinibacillus odysseyi 34hs-1 = NBRC 100172 TaxID=1220589 RepID=A0A0A3JCS8_9BACI|nr:alpha/beta fold hydrolase [Lysinibacillus odysseyi]KGR84802.1 alpha/beta hydrolase [Lysinibacillus odysseyi 34hs-1 = NBRC 100172]
MARQEKFFKMSDGQEVYAAIYEPKRTPVRGHVHILHGMAEHGARYDAYAEVLAEIGYFVSLHDHRGHGKTVDRGGQLGFFSERKGFERVVRDVFEVTQLVRKGRDLPPMILFGHSMGSFIARRYAQLFSSTIKALILCGTGTSTPMHAVGNRVANMLALTKGKKVRSEFMTEMSFGSFNKSILNPNTAYDWLSRDTSAVQTYIEDPKCGFTPTNQFFADLTYGIQLVGKPSENARIRHDLPVLLISGSADPVGNYGKGVFKVAEQLREAGLENVCVHIFEGLRHEILNETNKEQVYDVIIRWLKHGQTI